LRPVAESAAAPATTARPRVNGSEVCPGVDHDVAVALYFGYEAAMEAATNAVSSRVVQAIRPLLGIDAADGKVIHSRRPGMSVPNP